MSAMLADVNWPEGKLNRQFVFYPSRWTYLDRSKSCPWRRRRTCLWKKWYLWVKGFGFPPYCIQICICCAPCLACLPGSLPDWMSHQKMTAPKNRRIACASLRRALCDGPLVPSGWQERPAEHRLPKNWESFGLPILKRWLCLKMVSTPKPNGFHDHYPIFKWLFHWEYTLFSDKPRWLQWIGIIIPLSQDEHRQQTPPTFNGPQSATFNWTQHVVRLSLKECWHLGGILQKDGILVTSPMESPRGFTPK